jgi:hypothetical protein
VVGLAVVAALVWAGVYLTGRGDDTTPAPTGSPPVSTSTPTTPTPSPGTTVGPVASAAFPGEARADGGSFQVVPLAQRDEKCTTHTIDGTSAYLSDCTDWGDRAGSLYFFYVTVKNPTDENVTLKRSGFTITSGTDTFNPVGVADGAADPTTFIPKSRTIGPDGSTSGYLVFEVEGPFSPDELTYEGGGITLTITFEGEENVRPRA